MTPNNVAGLIAVPYVRPPGLPPQIFAPAPTTALALTIASPNVVAPVGSTTRLSVLVTDAFTGSPVAGAQASFTTTGLVYGLGTASSDQLGIASVACIPAQAGTFTITVQVSTQFAPPVTGKFTVVGQ